MWLHTKKHFVLAGNAEHTFERNDNEDRASVIQAGNGRIRSRVVHRELGERAVKLLNEKNELLLAHLRGDADFEENLAEYHRCRKAKKPKADAARVSSARALAGDRKRKRDGG